MGQDDRKEAAEDVLALAGRLRGGAVREAARRRKLTRAQWRILEGHLLAAVEREGKKVRELEVFQRTRKAS